MNKLAPEDGTIPYRLVGSYEYANAIAMLDQLISISSSQEIRVYDRMLDERPEFTYFNGINAAFATPPNLAADSSSQRKEFDDRFKKKGLAWMTALARIELAATASIYGKEKRPFEALSNPFDLTAYLEILYDDAVAHMKSLADEENFKKVLRRSHQSDSMTLAYLRRIKLIKDMLDALMATDNPEIVSRIRPLDRELSKHERVLVMKVLSEQFDQTTTNTKTSSRSVNLRESGAACRDFAANRLRRSPAEELETQQTPR